MFFNMFASIVIAVFAGGLYFAKDEKILAAITLIAAILYAVGYFDIVDYEQKESAK